MRRSTVQPVGGRGGGGGGRVHGGRGVEPDAGRLRQGTVDGGSGSGGAGTERGVEPGQTEDVEQQRQRGGRGRGRRRRGRTVGRRTGAARVGGQAHQDGTVFAARRRLFFQRRRDGRVRPQPVSRQGKPTAADRRRPRPVPVRLVRATVAVRRRGHGRNGHQHVADVR